MVITYKMSQLSCLLMRRKGYLPYVGLPNILAGRFVVPELLQDDATPENLAQAVLNLLQTSRCRPDLSRIREHGHRTAAKYRRAGMRSDSALSATIGPWS